MKALNLLFPIFFLLLTGWFNRHRHWISPQQKDGAFSLVVKVLFPFLIFNLMASASIASDSIGIVAYVLTGCLLIWTVCRLPARRIAGRQWEIADYMMMTNEGGNIALPLFLSLVGLSSLTIMFDLAVIGINFIVVPLMISRQQQSAWSLRFHHADAHSPDRFHHPVLSWI